MKKLYTQSGIASRHGAIGKFLDSVVLLASALAIMAPEPVFAGLQVCNHTHGASTLALALAYYNFGTSHVRSSKDNFPDLAIIVQPRWSIRGWWEIPQHECVTVIDHDLDQTHYYYAYSQDHLYNYSGDYQICGRRYGRFHIEYKIDNNKLVQILALKPWGIDTASVDPETNLEEACANLGYELLPFNQVNVGDTGDYIFNFAD